MVERFGLTVLPLRLVKASEVVKARSDTGMRRFERFFSDAESTLVEGFGPDVLPLSLVDFGKIVEAGGHFEMVWTEGCFTQNQETLIQRFGFLRLILRTID